MTMNRHDQVYLVTLLLLHISPSLAVSRCYGAISHKPLETIFTPCNTNQPFSMCYRSQSDSSNNPPDIACLPNGVTVSNNTGWGIQYWRQSCTDPTWESPYCLAAFQGCKADGGENAQITPCDGKNTSTTWCCGSKNTSCCSTDQVISIAAVLGPASSISSMSASSTSSMSFTSSASSSNPPSTSPTSVIQSLSPQPNQNNSGLSTGAKAGIGIAAALGGIAIIVGLVVLFVLRRKRKESAESHYQTPELDSGNNNYRINGGYELDAKNGRNELEAKHGRSELPGN